MIRKARQVVLEYEYFKSMRVSLALMNLVNVEGEAEQDDLLVEASPFISSSFEKH